MISVIRINYIHILEFFWTLKSWEISALLHNVQRGLKLKKNKVIKKKIFERKNTPGIISRSLTINSENENCGKKLFATNAGTKNETQCSVENTKASLCSQLG